MSSVVPVDARLVSAGDPLFHCRPETPSEEGRGMAIGSCSWFAKCRKSSGHERARTGARAGGPTGSCTLLQGACTLSRFSRVRLSATLWTAALQGFSAHGILQARILEWFAMPSSRVSSPPRDRTLISCVSRIAGRFFKAKPPGEPKVPLTLLLEV